MPDFLLELFSEEIPAGMQARGAEALRQALLDSLTGVPPQASESFHSTRRIGVSLIGLPDRSEDRRIETRGPRVGAPAAALAGFLKAAGLASAEQCEVRDTGKGEFYFALKTEPGQKIGDLLAALVPDVLDKLVWPKSMRWSGHDVRWVRPLHNILAILTDEAGVTVVPIKWRLDRQSKDAGDQIEANDATFGHRFLAPDRFTVSSIADYRAKLADGFVLPDEAKRKERILDEGARLAAEIGCTMKPDPGLLDEVAGLVEYPVVMLGKIEPRFMALPSEVLTTSMRTHQKYFALETADGTLAPYFIVVANNLALDGGAQIIAGNERVLRARLSDAEFFWQQDTQKTLESRVDRLAERVFHAKLGTVHDKITRMGQLVDMLADKIPGADVAKAKRAVILAKADLSSALVGEFPELQGIMGRYLALHDGESPDVADAIARHYAPLGASDPAPSAPLDIIVSLADKFDTLAGFFQIGEPPTGSKDPYALRRAALGIIRIVLENNLRLNLRPVLAYALGLIRKTAASDGPDPIVEALLAFFADRLKVALRDQGIRHDLISAVFALGSEDDLVSLVARTQALQSFLATDDGANLLTAYRRASKIVGIESKKDRVDYGELPDRGQLELPEELTLEAQLGVIRAASRDQLYQENYTGAMMALARLRRPVDDFFERVTVNVDRPVLRANRLRLLAQIWQALDRIADFSKIEG